MVEIWVMYKIEMRGGAARVHKSFSQTDPIWQCLDIGSY